MRIVCLISGGIDSTTLLFKLTKNNHQIIPLFVNYGQKSRKFEQKAANKACDILDLKLNVINIPGLAEIVSGLTDETVSTSKSFFPSRNLILLSIAAAFSSNTSCNVLAIGIIDGTNYSDQSTDFVKAAENALSYGRKITILAPLLNLNKLEVVRLAKVNNIPLDFTHSCYSGSEEPCMRCASCIDRKRVFEIEGLINP